MKRSLSVSALLAVLIAYIVLAPRFQAAAIGEFEEGMAQSEFSAESALAVFSFIAEEKLSGQAGLPESLFAPQAEIDAFLDSSAKQMGLQHEAPQQAPPQEDATNEALAQDEPFTEEELYWLSRVIQAEAGGSWMPDWFQQAVGSVVLNRVESGYYPDSIKDVIFDQGQYSCVDSGSIYQEPSEKVVRNAREILENGSTLPHDVLGQSEFVQGEIYEKYDDEYLGTTTYFCYMGLS